MSLLHKNDFFNPAYRSIVGYLKTIHILYRENNIVIFCEWIMQQHFLENNNVLHRYTN